MRALAVGSSEGEEIRLGEDRAWYEDAEDAAALAFLQDAKRRNKHPARRPCVPAVRPAGALRLAELGSAGGTLSVLS